MDRFVVVSADCHWGDSVAQYREYLEPKYFSDFDAHIQQLEAQTRAFEMIKSMMSDASDEALASLGYTNMEERREFASNTLNGARLEALEADGVAGEVIFPNMVVPFSSSFSMLQTEHSAELQIAGMRAYNRALADFIDPDRQVGLALVSYLDIEEAVKEVRWARSAGLRGVLVGSVERGLPTLGLDPAYYEPLWRACVEEGMPIHLHGGAGMPADFDRTLPGAMKVWGMESVFYAHRALWFLIFGGVPERYPALQVVFTEMFSDWIPRVLVSMDYCAKSPMFSAGDTNTLLPSEYWSRQFHCGSSVMSSWEVEHRHEIGVNKIMFGTDFPHPEGTWGQTTAYLQAAFGGAGVSEDEVRLMLGENAMRLYRLDADKLREIGSRIGPRVADVLSKPSSTPDIHVKSSLARPPCAA